MAEPATRLDPDESLGYQVRRCHRQFDRLLNAVLAPHGLSSGFWYYLRVLWQRDGVTQKSLSDELNVAENSTVATITAMARQGWVGRARDAVDRRKIRVSLTGEARALEPRLIPLANEVNAVALNGIDPAEVAICLSVLKRAAANLERERTARTV